MKQDQENSQDSAASKATPVEVIRLGKDEMNLAEFPITLLTDRVPKGKKVIKYEDRIFDEKSGKQITRTLTISADEAHGLPTAVDDDVILGLIQLTKLMNNFTSREVEFSRLDLIRQLGWPDSGDSYRRLATSLKRWLSVTLLYENAWRDNRKGAWITKGFHILDNIELNDTRTTTEQGELFPSKITWNKVVFESFEAGYLKSIDYGLFIRLRSPIARRMYRFLSKRMYFGPDQTFDLRDLAFAHIGLSDSYSGNAGKIKEKLQPALKELEAAGFLEPMSKEGRYKKEGKDWKIRLIARTANPAALSDGVAPAADQAGEPALVAELIRRHITAKTAARLCDNHPANLIEQQIEVFDWLVAKKDKRIATSPAGYLVKSITDGYAMPKGFITRAEQQRQADARQAKERAAAEAKRRQQQADAGERKARKEVEDYWSALSDEQKAEHQASADAAADPESLTLEHGPLKRMGQQIRRDAYIRTLLNTRDSVPARDY